jgi:hypothetical protein
MRSRVIRLTLGAASWIGLGVAALLFFRYETQIGTLGASMRVFEQRARDATGALSDVRAAEQAYVAAGQGVAFWSPKVAEATSAVTSAFVALRESTGSTDAQSALDQAASALAEFHKVDRRAQSLVKSGQLLTAGDTIFSDGANAIATAAHQLELARAAEHQSYETREATLRDRQTLAIASAAALACLIVVVLLVTVGAPAVAPLAAVAHAAVEQTALPAPVTSPVARASGVLVTAAALATDFGRVRDSQELERLLGRAAEALDASGIVVWMRSLDGSTLQPALTHGYGPKTIARIQAMPRSADNAAAAAYRSATLRIVLARPGGGNGAVVAPILSIDGCIGVFSAEIRGGAETSEGVQALAGIIAAHLASVVAIAPAETPEKKVANS